MIVGYAFASHKDPFAEKQTRALQQAQCDELVVEQTDIGLQRRATLTSLLERIGPADMIIVASLDRLARSLPELLDVLRILDNKAAHLRSLSDCIDTMSPEGRSVLRLGNILLDAERTMLIERTQAGRQQAKRKGEKLGRKPKMSSDQIEHARQLIRLGETGRSVARTFSVSEATLYRSIRLAV
jgi:DNA invertase Pin-like site-specific DNA recombinase